MKRAAVLLTVAGCAAPVTTLTEAPASSTVQVSTPPRPWLAYPRVTPTASIASRTRPFTGLTASGPGRTLSSTAYCETGLMANGRHTRRGAVAGNRWPIGTRLRVNDSPYGPGTFVVEDRIGHGSELDFAIPGDCTAAREWGRRRVIVEVIP